MSDIKGIEGNLIMGVFTILLHISKYVVKPSQVLYTYVSHY